MLKKTILVLLVLNLCLAIVPYANSQTEQVYTLDILGPTWGHSTISVLIIPSFNESWWNPIYLNSSLRAINQWNEAIVYFASNHTDYAYLSRLKIEPTISNSTSSSFDVTVSWIKLFENLTCGAGLTRTYMNSRIINNSTIELAAYDCQNRILSETDTQNVALQELGHSLGLGHTNTSGDPMYPTLSLSSPLRKISTLNIYGLATVFRWLTNSTEYNTTNQESPVNSVILPSNIAYDHLPVSVGNIPPPSTAARVGYFFDDLGQLLQLDGLLLILSIVSIIIVIFIVLIRVRKKF
ncbi:MAG TPA: matrixin family metalloprotease [Candidatus Sulfotelmatobacter sp.]|nr:matrixin family metalloprotease [Candidatus Sulfotelmatobacter sp.]